MAVKAFDQIASIDSPVAPEGIRPFSEIESSAPSDLLSRGYLTTLDQEVKDSDKDFELSTKTLIPTSELQAFGNFRPKRKRPLLEPAAFLAGRFAVQLRNTIVSSVVRTLTDGDLTVAQERAVELIDEWESKNGIKLTDVLYEDQLADWTNQLYEKPEARDSDFLKDEPQFEIPEKIASYFDPVELEKSEGWLETSVDAAAGIIGYGVKIAAFRNAFPNVPPPLAWETVNLANGGPPGAGASMFGAMGVVGRFFPATKPVLAKLGSGVGVGAIFGVSTALAGGDTKEIIVNTGLPILLGFMSVKRAEWDALKPKSKLELIRAVRDATPQLKSVTIKEMDTAIRQTLVEKEVAGIRRLGKKPSQKPPLPAEKPVKVAGKETAVSRVSERIQERAILEGIIGKEGIENLPEHVVAKRKKQAKIANRIPRDKAIKIVLGEEPLPEGVLDSAVFVAVKNRAMAEGDVATITRLAQSNRFVEATTRRAQELQALANERKYSPVQTTRDVIEARGVIPDKKLAKTLGKAEKKLNKVQEKLSNRIVDLTIKDIVKGKPIIPKARVDIKAKTYGAKNRFITRVRANEALKRLGDVSTLSAGINPARFLDVLEVSAFHLEAVGRNLPVWTKAMKDQFGERIAPHLKELWKKSMAKLDLAEKEGSVAQLKLGFEKKSHLLNQTKAIRTLQESLIRSGFKSRGLLLKEMHRILSRIDPTITERQTMDAMSGAGKFKLLNKDEIKVIRRDINNQFQQVAKLQDMAVGIAPSATGFERQPPSAEGRRLIKLVNEAKKKGGFESVSPERELKSTLASIKTRLTNRIEELKEQLKTGKRTIKTKKPQPTDVETIRLTKERDALQKEFDAVFGAARKVTPDQRIKAATKSLNRSIVDLERRIKEGDLSAEKKAPKITSQEIEALQSRRDALKEELQNMKDIANPKKTPQELSLQAYKTRLANERARFDEMIVAGDFEKPPKVAKILDKEAIRLLGERDTAKRTVQIAREVMRQKGGIAAAEVQRLNELSNSIEANKILLESNPKNKKLQIDYGNSILDFEEYSNILVPKPRTWRTIALDVAGTPRTIMTSLDLSFPFRQGWGSMGTKEFWQAFGEQFKYAWSEKNLRNLMAEIKGSPRLQMARKSGLRLTDLGSRLELREEGIQSTFADRIPIVGRYIRASQRAYTGMANYIRWNRFNNMVDAAIMQGRSVQGAEGLKLTRDIANVINIFTGSGNLGRADKFGNIGPAFNQLLFSARKLSADINMLDPRIYGGVGKYTKLDPFARRMAQRQFLGSLAMTSSILSLAAMSGVDIELNPTSGNFGKIVIGNKRVDITGGKASLFTFLARTVTGKIKDTETGELEDTTPFLKGRLATRFGRGKLAPMVSLYVDIYLQQDFLGDPVETPIEITKAVASRFYPMAIADAVSLFEDDVDGDMATKLLLDISLSGAALLGASVNVFEDETGLEGF